MNALFTRFPVSTFYRRLPSQVFQSRKFTKKFDVAVVGAGPVGMSAALYGKIAGLHVGVFESKFLKGEISSDIPVTHNVFDYPASFLSGALSIESKVKEFKEFNGSFFSGTSIKRISKKDFVFLLEDQNDRSYLAKTIILATGIIYKPEIYPDPINLDEKGYVLTSEVRQETSVKGIFAAGIVTGLSSKRFLLGHIQGVMAMQGAMNALLEEKE